MQALPLGGSVGPITNPVLIGTLELAAQAGAPSFFLLSVSPIFPLLFLDVGFSHFYYVVEVYKYKNFIFLFTQRIFVNVGRTAL